MRKLQWADRLRTFRLRKKLKSRIARRALRKKRSHGGEVTFQLHLPRHRRCDVALFKESVEGVPRVPVFRSSWDDAKGRVRPCWRLQAPENFTYDANPDGVMAFIYELRRQVFVHGRQRTRSRRRPGLYVDLDGIRSVDLEGALILAAELDRLRQIFSFTPTLDDERWDPTVRAILYGVGLYGVIEAQRLRNVVEIADWAAAARKAGVEVVPFESDGEALGEKAMALRDRIYELCEPPTGSKRPAYDSLMEAILNSIHHAYPEDIPGDGLPRVKRWWAGALVDRQEGYLYLVVYDQGVGIPATLPKRPWWQALRAIVPELSDKALLDGALQLGRTGTGIPGRGNGMATMCRLTEKFDDAEVTFTSGRGQVTYLKGGERERADLATRFAGTLIRWRAKIGTQEPAR